MKPEQCKAIVPDLAPEVLSWRAATGADFRDEVWNNVYHVAPDKSPQQLEFENNFECWLFSYWANQSGRRVFRDTRLSADRDWEPDFRVPAFSLFSNFHTDSYCNHVLLTPPDVVIEFEGNHLAGTTKIDFYRRVGVREIWVVDIAVGTIKIFGFENRKPIPTLICEGRSITSPLTGIEIDTQDDNVVFRYGAFLPDSLDSSRLFDRFRRKAK